MTEPKVKLAFMSYSIANDKYVQFRKLNLTSYPGEG